MGDAVESWDVLLMAVADGEASSADQQRVMEAVAHDEGLALQLEGFRRTGRSLGGLFNHVLTAPLPEQLLQTVLTAGPPALVRARRPQSGWTSWFDWLGGWLGGWQMPAAALAALAIGFAAHDVVLASFNSSASGSTTVAMADRLVAGGSLAEALSVATTGAERQITTKAGALSFRVVETFANQSGLPCREYEAQGATGPRQFGIACRDGSAWHLKAVFEGAPKSGSATVTAGPDVLGEVLDSMVEHLRQGEALNVDAERRFIANGWAGKVR